MSDLYKSTPSWILKIIEKKKCAECGAIVKKTDICAIGIRKVTEEKNTLYVEHLCSKCAKRTITSLAKEKVDGVEGLCYLLIEEMHNLRKIENSSKRRKTNKKGSISDQEFKDMVKFLNNNDTHLEFMKYIGINVKNESK